MKKILISLLIIFSFLSMKSQFRLETVEITSWTTIYQFSSEFTETHGLMDSLLVNARFNANPHIKTNMNLYNMGAYENFKLMNDKYYGNAHIPIFNWGDFKKNVKSGNY